MRSIIAIDGHDCAGFADYVVAFAVLVALQKDGVKATMHCPHSVYGSRFRAGVCVACWSENCADEARAAARDLAKARTDSADYETIRRLERAYGAASDMGD